MNTPAEARRGHWVCSALSLSAYCLERGRQMNLLLVIFVVAGWPMSSQDQPVLSNFYKHGVMGIQTQLLMLVY